MVITKVVVSAIKINEAINQFQNRAEEIRGVIGRMQRTIDRLREIWRGRASDEYQERYNQLRRENEESLAVAEDYILQLREALRLFSEAESNITNQNSQRLQVTNIFIN